MMIGHAQGEAYFGVSYSTQVTRLWGSQASTPTLWAALLDGGAAIGL